MNSQIGFIVKVLILSTALSVLIKYGGQMLAIAPSQTNALLGIFVPTLLMAIALGWRVKKQAQLTRKAP
jgi:hypothetical protein